MDILPASSFVQAQAEAEHAGSVARWRAAETVRARVIDLDERAELLGALGLLDAACPASYEAGAVSTGSATGRG